ncbi:hypothetical protein RHOSPDRAFT_32107 [Rhodotorula sp. JG-1b]|nr:hypothetical protein RHOSPDRAFT_32107 [Rhodotorula sp. JG-1b]
MSLEPAVLPIRLDSYQNLQLLRYTLEVEALDRGKNVQKRISVIFPIQPPAATQQQPLPNTTLCPRKARNIVRLPPIRHLSLLPPAPKVPRFRSLAPVAASELRVEPESASADTNDARRIAEDLARSTAEVGFASPVLDGRTAAWAHDQQQRLRKRAYPSLLTAANAEAPSTNGAASDGGGPLGSGDSSASGSSLPAPMQLHSTSTALSSLVVLAHDSLRDHISDYADAHRWIDSFFDKLESRATASNGGPRPALSELMKTPGRKRTVGANATNHAAAGHSLASAKKDPLATLLFADAGSARAHSPHDKENSTFSATGSGTGTRTSPRKLLSPLAAAATASSRTGKPAASPIRLSPRPALATASKEKTKAQSAPVPEPAPAQEPVVEVASVEPEQPTRPVAEPPVQEEPEPTTIVLDVVEKEVKADLSIIGEEEEEDAAEVASSFRASEAATSLVMETQLSQPIANTSAQLPPRSVLSPPRNVSNASSVAPEADAEEDHTVPLNDAPSTLRSADLSSSLSASTTRTPGSSTSRFTLGTYSAGKLGGLGIGSSPPPAGTAPATAGGRLANPRISSGGPAPRQLNFVGLPKKSLGHGLGLGRGWNNQSGSNVGDSQSSTGTSNKSVTLSDSAPATDVEVEQATTVTASGSTKRKSITGPDLANKTPKLAEPALTEQELKRKRYEELNNRMQSLQARQSVLGGRASNVAGPFGANAIFGANKPFGGSSSSLFQSTAPLASAKTTVGATQSTAVPASAPAPEAPQAANARRPSVMERVRSFESNTTGAESMHPPSPSKIPSALAANSHHVARPTSPPLSPRRLASPGPASPRLMGRSATFALPLASFGSPRSAQSTTASPRVAALSRSPTAQASMSISSMLESAPKAPVAKLQSPSKSPVRPDITATATRSSTPVGSPRALNLQVNRAEAKAREQVDAESRAPEMPVAEKVVHEEEGEEEEEEDEPTMSIRAVNASVDPATVAAAEAKKRAEADAAAEAERVRDDREAAARRAAEQAARALEEQEAQREREELLKKRLPSLPEPKAPTDDEASSSDEEREDQATKVAPSAPPPKGMPGSFAAEDAADDMEQDDDDLTSMSVMSTATASSTLNLTQHQPFKPVVAHKATGVQKHAAKSSIASSVSTTSTLSRSVSNNALATSISKKPKIEVNAVKRAAAAAKKEKEERERQAALREEKRAALLKRKQEEERKAKVEGLEKKRKEREEAATKATKGSVIRGVKPKTDEEPAKKRKIEPDARSAQPSLAASQGRAGGMGPPPSALNKSAGASSALNKSAGPSSALSKSTGATAMIGHSFMSSKINLAGGGATAQPRPPAPNASKPLGPTSGNAPPPRAAVEQQQRAPAPAPEPEVYQELPDIDSEYSDSDDEVAQEQKQAALPGWAKSPNLVRALQRQQEINPDDIFGPIPKLSIGEMFRNANSTARLRLRTSSARWEGTDDLTQADIARYHRAMGFRSTSQQPGPSNSQQ